MPSGSTAPRLYPMSWSASRRVTRRSLLKAPFQEQRFDTWIAAAEGAVHRGHVLCPTARKNHFAKALSVGAGQTAVLLEPVVRVVIDDFAPEVSVIPGGVA